MSKYIGDVSAYAYAVSKGYTGTEEEFAELMASYADVGQTAVDAKDAAVAAKTAAQTAATIANNKASEATTAAQTATTKAGEAQTSAQTASTKASEASQSASTASQKATEASQSATNAGQSAQTAEQAKTASQTAQGLAESARDSAISAKNDAESARDEAQDIVDGINAKAEQIDQNTADITELESTKADLSELYKAFPTDTALGAIASFSDGADDIPLKSLVVDIDPVQDLHGYDSPWPAGWGKNLIHSSVAETIVIGTATRYGKIYEAGTYYITATEESIAWYRIYQNDIMETSSLNVGTNVREAVVNSGYHLAVFAYNAADLEKVCVANQTITKFYPYENICPISGWTGANVNVTGYNVWDEVWEVGGIDPTNGRNNEHTNRLRSKNYSPCRPSTTYWFKKADNAQTYRIVYYDKEQTFIESSNSMSASAEFTTPDNCYFVRFFSMNPVYSGDISINYPSTDHDYHPYAGQTIPISWQTEAGAVYGGELDVLSGKLTVERATAVYDGTETYSNTYFPTVVCTKALPIGTGDGNTFICSHFPPGTYYAKFSSSAKKAIQFNHCDVVWRVSSADELKSVFAQQYANGTPVTICYPLAEPLTIQLTPHEVKSLLGQNNIFADTGDTMCEYRADTKLYINRLTEPDADMIADANITSGQYFMVGNNLYKATANIANGGQINVGTNCTRVSLAQALNEINA